MYIVEDTAQSLSTATSGKNLESTLIIIAEYGSVKLSGQYLQNLDYCYIKDQTEADSPVGQVFSPEKLQQLFYQEVITIIRGQKPDNQSAIAELKVVELIEQIYATR